MTKGNNSVSIEVLRKRRESDEAGNGDWVRLWVGTECQEERVGFHPVQQTYSNILLTKYYELHLVCT